MGKPVEAAEESYSPGRTRILRPMQAPTDAEAEATATDSGPTRTTSALRLTRCSVHPKATTLAHSKLECRRSMFRDLLRRHLDLKAREQPGDLLMGKAPLSQHSNLVVQHLNRLIRCKSFLVRSGRLPQLPSGQ